MALGPVLTDLLKRAGLEGLTQWASDMIINGASDDEIMVDMYDQPAFKQRFWMIFQRRTNGYPAASVEDVLAYEQAMFDASRALGVTATRQQMGEWFADNKSVPEMQDRMGIAATAVYQSPPEHRAALNRLYGITDGDLVNYWLDPKKETPILQRRFAAAQIAGEAARVGFRSELTTQQAEGLFEAGVDMSGAREGFATLVESEELFEAVDVTEEDIGVSDQLSLLTGNARLTEQVGRRGERRAARFQEGGGFAPGQEGLAGLGSANR